MFLTGSPSIKYMQLKPIKAHFNSTRATPGSWIGVAWVICGFLKDVSAGALQLNNRSLTRCLKSAIRSARLGTHTRLATKLERFPAHITSGVLGHAWKKTLCKRK